MSESVSIEAIEAEIRYFNTSLAPDSGFVRLPTDLVAQILAQLREREAEIERVKAGRAQDRDHMDGVVERLEAELRAVTARLEAAHGALRGIADVADTLAPRTPDSAVQGRALTQETEK